MRIANLDHRLVLLVGDGAVDVATTSSGRFTSDPQAVYADWDAFTAWAATVDATTAQAYDPTRLGAPTPAPGQIFAVGLNYADHAGESGLALPAEPAVFTKFVSSITGPDATVELPTATVDWEVELVVVIGRPAYRVGAARAWEHVAGLTIGQDLSERTRQLVPPAPQFSLGKSFPGFSRSGRGSSPPTSWSIATTSSSVAPSTVSRSRRVGPRTCCSVSPSWSNGSRRSCRSARATSSSPGHRAASGTPAAHSATSPPATC